MHLSFVLLFLSFSFFNLEICYYMLVSNFHITNPSNPNSTYSRFDAIVKRLNKLGAKNI